MFQLHQRRLFCIWRNIGRMRFWASIIFPRWRRCWFCACCKSVAEKMLKRQFEVDKIRSLGWKTKKWSRRKHIWKKIYQQQFSTGNLYKLFLRLRIDLVHNRFLPFLLQETDEKRKIKKDIADEETNVRSTVHLFGRKPGIRPHWAESMDLIPFFKTGRGKDNVGDAKRNCAKILNLQNSFLISDVLGKFG